MSIQQRSFIRHPSDIPVRLLSVNDDGGDLQPMTDVSIGGLSCHSSEPAEPGHLIKVGFPLIDENELLDARVVWCHQHGQSYQIGIEFFDAREAFRARMCEQICHIEQYRKDVKSGEGRELSAEAAAEEWIDKYASTFP